MSDSVKHQKYYFSDGIEVIDVIKAFTKDCTPFEAYCSGNVIKYICRWKHKNGIEDLKKARAYLDMMIDNAAKANTSIKLQQPDQPDSWFLRGVPTVSNEPASTWTTDELKKKHIGNRYIDLETGYCYEWNGTEWVRVEITKTIIGL